MKTGPTYEEPAKPSIEMLDWGMVSYREAAARQEERVVRRLAGAVADALIFVEHPPVFTVGVRRGAAAHLVWTEEKRRLLGIDTVDTNRGGDVTYHGPGQVIGYPVVHLGHLKSLHTYLRILEETLTRTARRFDLPAGPVAGKTGIWIENRKLAAIGVGVRRWVAFHGFAININNDLEPFTGIIPCGLAGAEVTSMGQELGREIDPDEVKSILKVEFRRAFSETVTND